jgi:chemotaxis-related protein WspD
MTTLPVIPTVDDCWNRIGVHGDRSCPELARVVHCHNCEVFAGAGRRFLDAPSPAGYLEEWTRRLADPIAEESSDLQGVLIFRLAEEWLALPVAVLVEVTTPRPVHRVPHRGGILAGLVNIRGELHLCARLDQVLGIPLRKEEGGRMKDESGGVSDSSFILHPSSFRRLLVVRQDAERWVLPVDEVAQVHRLPLHDLTGVPATLGRAAAHLTRGVFHFDGRAIGLLDEERLFATLRSRLGSR